MVGINEASNQI
jgi:hypothetical protein